MSLGRVIHAARNIWVDSWVCIKLFERWVWVRLLPGGSQGCWMWLTLTQNDPFILTIWKLDWPHRESFVMFHTRPRHCTAPSSLLALFANVPFWGWLCGCKGAIRIILISFQSGAAYLYDDLHSLDNDSFLTSLETISEKDRFDWE